MTQPLASTPASPAAPDLIYRHTLTLPHTGDCGLLAVAPDLSIYVEEIYAPDCWVAQHHLSFTGEVITSVDENFGQNADVRPLPLPPDASTPHPGWHTPRQLQFSGPRHRGMREPERLSEVVRPLTLPEKMTLIRHLKLDLSPMLLFGLAESYVLSEVEIVRPQWYIVCRRVRLAVALPAVRLDDSGQPYDYETLILHLAHWHNRQQTDDVPLVDLLESLPGVHLRHPQDVVMQDDYLFIADSGGASEPNQVHVWEIVRPPVPPADESQGRPGESPPLAMF